LKNPKLLQGVEVTWFKTVPFLNYPRWHDRHFIPLKVMFHLSPFPFTRGCAKAKCGGVVDGS
jgi:hypothetical protein